MDGQRNRNGRMSSGTGGGGLVMQTQSEIQQLATLFRQVQQNLATQGVDSSPENMATYLLQALVQSRTPPEPHGPSYYSQIPSRQCATDQSSASIYHPKPSIAADVPERLSRMLEHVYKARGLQMPGKAPKEIVTDDRERQKAFVETEMDPKQMQMDVDEGPEREEEDPDKIIDRMAKARRRNREAQQRFRNRRREKLSGMESDYQALCDTRTKIEEENIALEERAHYLSRIIIMREIILHSLTCDAPEKDSLLFKLMGGMNFEKASVAAPEFEGEKSKPEETSQQPTEPVEQVEEERPGPSSSGHDIFEIARSLDEPESFFLYWREWQIEIKHALTEYEQFKSNEMKEELIRKFDNMVKIWAVNSRLYPNNFKVMMAEHSLPDEEGASRWKEVAKRVFETMPEEKVQLLNDYWERFISKMSDYNERRIEVAEKLARHQELIKESDPNNYCMQTMSNNHLMLGYLTGSLNYLSEKTWITNVRLSSGWNASIGEWNSCICNALAAPYPPNWVAICKEIAELGKAGGILGDQQSLNDNNSSLMP